MYTRSSTTPDSLRKLRQSIRGFTALPLDDGIRALLTADVADHTAWSKVRRVGQQPLLPLPDPGIIAAPASRNAVVRQYIIDICRSLIDAQELLDALDARVGDGDTGSTFATAARRLLDGVDDLPLNDTPALAAEALHAGQLAMQRDGSARLGDRTMLDALGPAIDAAQRQWSERRSVGCHRRCRPDRRHVSGPSRPLRPRTHRSPPSDSGPRGGRHRRPLPGREHLLTVSACHWSRLIEHRPNLGLERMQTAPSSSTIHRMRVCLLRCGRHHRRAHHYRPRRVSDSASGGGPSCGWMSRFGTHGV